MGGVCFAGGAFRTGEGSVVWRVSMEVSAELDPHVWAADVAGRVQGIRKFAVELYCRAIRQPFVGFAGHWRQGEPPGRGQTGRGRGVVGVEWLETVGGKG